MTAPTELDLLRAFAHASIRTETRLCEMRGAKLAARALTYREYVAERDDRDSFLALWRRFYGNAQIFAERTGARPSVVTEPRSSEPPRPVPPAGRVA